MRTIAILGPHIKLPEERERIWKILHEHHLDPMPLAQCGRYWLTQEQVGELIALSPPDAPIPEFRPDFGPYSIVELRATGPATKGFVQTTLSAIVEGSSAIPPWAAGKKLPRSQRRAGCPNRRMREIMYIVSGETADRVSQLLGEPQDAAA